MTTPSKPRPGNSSSRKDDDQAEVYRRGFGLKSEVEQDIAGDYHSSVVDSLRRHDHSVLLDGLELRLAREFGFCYGVDKAVDYAYQTRRMFPDRRIFLTAEIIHNPGVNQRLRDMGIEFLSGRYCGNVTYEDLTAQDIVILPAFGAAVEQVERLRVRGCTLVDTTCGSVIHVWKRVEKYARDGFTAVIHGRYRHEETIATSSHVAQFPNGRYIIVRDKGEAQVLCDFIVGRCSADVVRESLGHAASANFDPERDLVRVGVANQTTMLSSESMEIADMLRRAMVARYGEENIAEHFRNFDTICSATQDRQDAIHELGASGVDLILVVGGFNSSNTSHLVEIAASYCPAYHIESVADLISSDAIRHKRWDHQETEITRDWLPPRPARIGFTGGASTPDRAIGEVIVRVLEFYGLKWPAPETQ